MLSDATEKLPRTASRALLPTALAGQPGHDERDYPDKLDAALLKIACVCGLACIMAILDNTAVAVAQRTFIAQFGSTQAIVSWTIAGYMLAFATVIPLTGWAADRFGTKRLFMGSVLAFTLGSLLCALAPNILSLVIFRVLQGIGGGMLLPLSFVILTHEAGPKRVGRLLAIGGIPILLGPIGGPILGGWMIGAFGWESIFLINLPVGLAAFVLAEIMFPKDRPVPTEKLDIVGVLLLSPGAAIFLAGVSSIPGRHTIADRYVLIPGIIGLALIAAFIWHAWYRAEHPLIDLRLFKNRVVAQANITLLVFVGAFVGTGMVLPSYFQLVLHQTPMQSGMHMVPVGIGAVLTMPLAGAFTDKHGSGKVVLVGLPLMAAGLGIFTFGVSRQADYVPTLLVGLLIMGLGIGCTTTPISATVLQSLAPHQIARGTTLMTVNQQVGGSIGASFMAVILTNEFTRNDAVVTANKITALQQDAARSGVPVNPSAIPRQALAPDFAGNVMHGLSHAYTIVFVLAVVMIAATIIPAAFLPKRPASQVVDE
jgi:MFS transporter, DHA2 family, multidrug resistance protein